MFGFITKFFNSMKAKENEIKDAVNSAVKYVEDGKGFLGMTAEQKKYAAIKFAAKILTAKGFRISAEDLGKMVDVAVMIYNIVGRFTHKKV